MPKFRRRFSFACVATIVAAQFGSCGRATAEDKLLTEVVNFTGTIVSQHKGPRLLARRGAQQRDGLRRFRKDHRQWEQES